MPLLTTENFSPFTGINRYIAHCEFSGQTAMTYGQTTSHTGDVLILLVTHHYIKTGVECQHRCSAFHFQDSVRLEPTISKDGN